MKKALARSAALLVAFVASTVAQAVPIHFDFTGRVSGGTVGAPLGAAASGGFRFDSDQFLFSGASGGIQYSWVAWQPAVTGPLAFLSVGDSTFTVPSGDTNYALINFADGCQPLCNLGWAENFNLSAYSGTATPAGFTGTARSTGFGFYNVYQNQLPDYPYWQLYDQFVGSQMQPLDVLSLPLASYDVSFLETTWDCVAGSCRETSAVSFQIALDSLTRSSPAQSVPEPGTLALLGLGLAGVFAARRRKGVRSI
jgi:hypothetical protein